MDIVGSYSPASGMPLQVIVSRSARWVTLRNDSPNYLYVQCGPRPPTSPTVAQSYAMSILPWSGDNYDTAGTSPGNAFDGVVYLIAYATTDLALSGTISARNQISVNTYTNEETPPQPYSGVPRQQDLSSQPRIIALAEGANSNATAIGGNLAAIGEANGYNIFSLSNGNPIPATMGFYLYFFTAVVVYAGIIDQQYGLSIVQKKAGGVITQTLTVLLWALSVPVAPAGRTTAQFLPNLGPGLRFSIGRATSDTTDVFLYLFLQSGVAGTGVTYTVAATLDLNTHAVIQPVGQGAPFFPVTPY